MRQRILTLVALALIGAGSAMPPAFGQVGDTPGDQRVRDALDELKLKYKVTDTGLFKLLYNTGDERDQMVYVSSTTTRYDSLEIREVWSIGYECEGPIPGPVANRLLEASESLKIGGWSALKLDSGKRRAVLTAKIAAGSSAKVLGSALEAVSTSADKVEKELTSKDDF